MSETWFEVNRWDAKIKPVKVVKVTDKTITIYTELHGKGRETRNAKESSYSRYFPDWESAYAFVLNRAERELEGARVRLQRAQGELGNVKGMKPPTHESTDRKEN